MKQTPLHHDFNPDLLRLLPPNAARIVEVGCSSGALAKAYLAAHPRCEYIGVETDPAYADVARHVCTRVLTGDIEHLDEAAFASCFPSTCWVFGDVIEHLYDPWALLKRIRSRLGPDTSVVACIPNAQHWSVQARLNRGAFRYEDTGLLDFTHIRWFTKTTIGELFESCGFRIVEGGGRVFDEPARESVLAGIRAMANATGADAEEAVSNAIPIQWVLRAVPDVPAHG